ncbi:MAG: rod shape-determining protein MreC [Candidatus Binatia bacterium]
MIYFFRRHQVLLTSFICLLGSLYILGAASTGRLQGDPVGPLLLGSMRPLQIGLQTIVVGVRRIRDRYRSLNNMRLENQSLKGRIVELEARMEGLLESEAINHRLQKLLDLKTRVPGRSVSAAVIGNSASTWFQSLTINKGENDGIRKGMAVISSVGIVGQVVVVARRIAKVLLITDRSSGVDVISRRSRARGIVSGSLDNGPVMKYVKRNEDIREGDRLITSGLDGIFPKGLLVGTVGKVRKESNGHFQHVEVALAVDPSQIEEVLVTSAGGDSLDH